MNGRRGVLFVIFDLPMNTASERKQYTVFRKSLIRSGYVYFQKSVYVKLLRNISSASSEIIKVESFAPDAGEVQTLTMNLNVFHTLYTVRGLGFRVSDFSDDIVFFGKEGSEEMEDEELLRLFE